MKYLENIKESKYVKYGKIESNFKPTVLIYKNINTIPLALSMRNSFNKFSIFRTLRLPNVDLSRVLESFIFKAHPTVFKRNPKGLSNSLPTDPIPSDPFDWYGQSTL